MSRSPIMLATLILVTSTFTIHPARRLNAQEKEKQASLWMKQKLSASQNILAGLTTADFGAIEKNAQSMLAVGYLERWVCADTPGYRAMMKDFEYANKSLVRAAREKNLDGATIGYRPVDRQLCGLPQGRARPRQRALMLSALAPRKLFCEASWT